MLLGREAEQRRLARLLDGARDERSAVLVLRGAPGIGKTALLDYAAQEATDMRILRCVGIEAEHELAFAGLHQLVRAHLRLIERLPGPQAAALKTAFGLSHEGVPDRFLVSLALLSLLAELCEDGPVLCCVDDAQWLDAPSAEALLFAARRLEAESIVLLIAVRDGEVQTFEAPGVPELELGRLPGDAARTVLTGRLQHRASPDVLDRLLRDADGNPLALLELPAALSSDQLEGREPIMGPPPVRSAVEAEFLARITRLPESVQQILLLAAVEEEGDPDALGRAASGLGLALSDLEAAEAAGLVRVDGNLGFRHPLVRSAVYRSASRTRRKAAHEALAAALDDPVRSAWHRAVVADGADERTASELEAAGAQAAARGGQASAYAAFERAAELSADPGRRGHRLTLAAQAALDAGRADAAIALVARARGFVVEAGDRAQLDLIEATDAGRRGSPAESQNLLRQAGMSMAPVASDHAAGLLVWSVFAGTLGWGDLALDEVGAELARLGAAGTLARFGREVVGGVADILEGRAESAGQRFAAAIALGEDLDEGPLQTLPAIVATFACDFPRARAGADRVVAELRARGSLASLVGTLPLLAGAQLGERRTRAAAVSVAEGLELGRQLGYENDVTELLALEARIHALHGRARECRERAVEAMQRGLASGVGWATRQARLALVELEVGLGNAREALEQFKQLDHSPLPPLALLATPDLLDAALRAGERQDAEEAYERFAAWAPVSRAPLVAGLLARCRALMAGDAAEAERLFEESLAELDHEGPVFERARTQLAYGERLRRDRRKTEARAQLRNALDAFEGLGAASWAERARGELRATGETARKRDVSALDELTPQELRIARLVADGGTNREVGAQLFVSPKTVDYHLRKVFLKLGISSRVELARVPLGEAAVDRD